jgi:hypothetical protein
MHDANELCSVAGVQPDAWLVENVERPNQARSKRCRQLNALRFAAGERGREAIQGEVVEANLVKKVNALTDLFENFPSDFYL